GGRVFDLNETRSAQTTGASKTPADDRSGPNPAAGSGTPASAATTQPAATPPTGGGPAAGTPQQTTSSPAASDTPTDAAGFMRRGMAHISRHEYPQAIADLTRACGLDPTDAECRYQRGLAYWHEAKREPALADLNAAIKLQPNDYVAHLARAEFELKQHPADAQTDLDAVDHLAPEEADLRLTLGSLYYSAGAYAAAVHQYDLWTEYHPDDNRLYYALSSRCASEGRANVDLDRALADCNQSLRLMPKNAPDGAAAMITYNRGMVYLRQEKLDSALADCDAVLQQQPKAAWARYLRGLVELRKGMTDQGQADLAAARAQKPDIAERLARFGLKP
ncbi:MAG TPA: tetratricopeptide repeat protein, partial [Steroidobacteraceae bacterium]|nr:tetratricopeptide repeat protein [Steroidobacteraceae bacterium]